jgi:protein-tyrosine phosphatase
MIFRNHEDFDVKSCGTSPQSRIKINEKLIRWADVIYVMEKRHKEIITQQFRNGIQGKTIKTLFIPDEFELMDERLIEILKEKIMPPL